MTKASIRLRLVLLVIVGSIAGVSILAIQSQNHSTMPVSIVHDVVTTQAHPTSTPTPALLQPPQTKRIPNSYHIYQTFNNCGPAALSMALSYYGVSVSQQELGQALRPYQHPKGDNDDKSVTLEELAEKSKEYGLVPFHRPNGTIELIKLFLTYDLPVVARTLLRENEDIGHYRVVKGYEDAARAFIQDDSLQGKNLRYSYDQFLALWEKFNYEYLVLVPEDNVRIAERILGDDADERTAWRKAVANAREAVGSDPDDIYGRFNLSVALYHVGERQQSVIEFETVERRLPFRTLWYQIEPIQAYYELGNYDRVFSITDRVLHYHNRAFSELYLIRGEIYRKQGNIQKAREEYEKAVRYNVNLKSAQKALAGA